MEDTSEIKVTSFQTDLSTYKDDGPWEYYITLMNL